MSVTKFLTNRYEYDGKTWRRASWYIVANEIETPSRQCLLENLLCKNDIYREQWLKSGNVEDGQLCKDESDNIYYMINNKWNLLDITNELDN